MFMPLRPACQDEPSSNRGALVRPVFKRDEILSAGGDGLR
jgi:hypothetical protein